MKRKQLIRTIALALVFVSLPVTESIVNIDVGSKLGLISSAFASTEVIGTNESTNIQRQLTSSSTSEFGRLYVRYMIDNYGNFTGVAVTRPVSSNINGACYNYYLFTISPTGELISSYLLRSGTNEADSLSFTASGTDYCLTYNSKNSGNFYYGFKGNGGSVTRKYSAYSNNITKIFTTDGTLTTDYTLREATSKQSTQVLKYGSIFLAFNSFSYGIGKAPYMESGLSYFAFTSANPTFKATLDKYNITFNYRTINGTKTSNIYSYMTSQDTNTIAPWVLAEVVVDKFNYMTFKGWDKELGNVTSSVTYNAVYEESSDSFWQDGNRYGIIEGTQNVILLGSTNNTLIVPKTITNNDTTYNITKVQDNVLNNNNTNITQLTVDSAQLASSALKANANLKKLTVTGTNSIIDNAFKGFTGLTEVNLSEGITSVGKSAFEGCTSLNTLNVPNSVASAGTNAFGNIPIIKASKKIVDTQTTRPRVYFYDEEGVECLAAYSVVSGTSLAEEAKKIGTKWIKDSGSVLGNITQDSTFLLAGDLVDNKKLANPTLTPSKTDAVNREEGITVTIE